MPNRFRVNDLFVNNIYNQSGAVFIGQSGFSGWSGASTSGYSGKSGWSGVSTSGYSGWSGASVSGYSGWSGAGDKYATTSTTSNSIVPGNLTFTVGAGLSYTPGQQCIAAYDVSHSVLGPVVSYSGTTLVISGATFVGYGTGPYTSWTVNVGGAAGATGASGISGWSGYSGAGVSGYSGWSGAAGGGGVWISGTTGYVTASHTICSGASATGIFTVGGEVNISSYTGGSLWVYCDYYDENGTGHTQQLMMHILSSPTIVNTATGGGGLWNILNTSFYAASGYDDGGFIANSPIELRVVIAGSLGATVKGWIKKT